MWAWCGDITYIPTEEGWLYLASVIDLASRHLVGWSMSTHHDAALVVAALDAAAATRGLKCLDGTIFHTDRGGNTARRPASPPAPGWGCAAP
jgi:putative transposase